MALWHLSSTMMPLAPSSQARAAAEAIADLQEHHDEVHRDAYAVNKLLRARLRKAKAEDAGLDARYVGGMYVNTIPRYGEG